MRGVRDGWAKIDQVPERTGDRVAVGAVHEVRSPTRYATAERAYTSLVVRAGVVAARYTQHDQIAR